MVFSSLIFLFMFFPAVIAIYYLAPKKLRNLVLFISSLIFYAWGEPLYIAIMLISAVTDFTCGILIDKYRDSGNRSKLFLLTSLFVNLGLLSIFKYYDFLAQTINSLLGTSLQYHGMPLPIGISFYTFQTMSYTIDVYRGKFSAQRNIIDYGTYVSLFSQLVAGPIVLYESVAKQLKSRRESIDSFCEGVKRFIIGLGKKVLLANNIGVLWDEIQKIAPGELTIISAWLGIIAFAFQIYFDFSGYSDMAIGISKIFGFNFPENFNYPYISKSISEFWRRWHISLGNWFREYVYIPLGGNRCSSIKLYRNLFVVWFLTGLWHGASWNFVVWGVYFGIIIAAEKAILLKLLNRLPKVLTHMYSLVLILIGWVLFSFEKLPQALQYIRVMFGGMNSSYINNEAIYYLYNYGIILVIAILASTPMPMMVVDRVIRKVEKLYYISSTAAISTIMFLSVAYLVDASYNPFLYFRF
jgi:alginate O-acetyltransferase complex protein AlgI